MVKCILGIVVLFTVSVWTEAAVLRNRGQKKEMSVSQRLQLANSGPNKQSFIVDGDIAVSRRVRRNADPCVNTGCKWPTANDGKVYVPYTLDQHFTPSARDMITHAMDSFTRSTCIRFYPRSNEDDFLRIQSEEGCWSYVGREGGAQDLSLEQPGCIDLGSIQHELLHALGFHHEQSRSDRDWYIRVNWDNTRQGGNFQKINTLNQGTPYDYGSVMHYDSLAFSETQKPVLEMVPKPSAPFGEATEMSPSDIERVNVVYCGQTPAATTATGTDEDYYDYYDYNPEEEEEEEEEKEEKDDDDDYYYD